MNKRALYIIIFIILVFVFGAMIYFVFLQDLFNPDDTNQNTNTTNQNTNTSLPLTNGSTNVNRTSINISNTNVSNNTIERSNYNGTLISNTAQGGETTFESLSDWCKIRPPAHPVSRRGGPTGWGSIGARSC